MSDGSVTQEEVDRLLFPKKQREFIEIQEDILKEIGSMKYDNTSDLYFVKSIEFLLKARKV